MVLRLKIYLPNKQIRRFSYDADVQKLSYASFVQWLSATVSWNQQENFVLHYLDDENDWVILGSDMEWRECLGSISGNVLRIKFVSGDAKPSHHHHHHHRRSGGCPWKMTSKQEDVKVGPNDAVMDITEQVRDVLPKSIGDALLGPKEDAIHYHIICDGCNTRNIRGNRYKCNTCSNDHDSFDLCQDCYHKKETMHDATHTFEKLDKPELLPWMNRCWQKVQTHLFPQQQEQKQEEVAPKEAEVVESPKQDVPKQQEVKPIEVPKVEEPTVEVSIPVFAKPIVSQQAPVPSAPVKEEGPYTMHLKILKDMGFTDETKLVNLLQKWNGNIQRVVNSYFD